MKETSVVAEEIPAIGITYQLELPGKKGLTFQTHVAQTDTQEAIDTIVDKIRAVGERQYWFQMIDVMTREAEQQERIAIDHHNRMHIVEQNKALDWQNKGKRGEVTLSAQEQTQRAQAVANAEEAKRRAQMAKDDLKKAYGKAGLPLPAELQEKK